MPIKLTFPKTDPSSDSRFSDVYRAYMQSPEWAAKRREALELADYTCGYCFRKAPSVPLEVHHLTYARFGHEDVKTDLRVLCIDCHEAVHSKELWPKILMMIRAYKARRNK